MTFPLLSIVSITYNHEKFIAKTIESFLMQKTNFDFEIVIGEDCSTDKTLQIIQDYKLKYPRKIKLISSEKNIGMMSNFIRTIKACTGKYIALCEGDDYWTDPYKLQKQVDFLEANPDFAICFHKVHCIFENNKENNYISNSGQKETTTIYDLAKGNYIHTCSVLFRNRENLLPDWFKSLTVGDYPLHLINATYGNIKFIDEVMGCYRIHDNGIWEHKPNLYRLHKWTILLNILKDKFDQPVNEIIEEQLKTINESLSDTIQEFCNENESLKMKVKQKDKDIMHLQKSISFRIGQFLLKPINIFRK